MDTLWTDNERWFTEAGMSFDGHACVRAFKDRHGGYNNHDLQVDSESVEVLRQLIVQNCTPSGWKKRKV